MSRQKMDPNQKKTDHNSTFVEGAMFGVGAVLELNVDKGTLHRPSEQMIQEGFEDFWVVASFEPGSAVKEMRYEDFKEGYCRSRPGEEISEAAIIRAFQVYDAEREAAAAEKRKTEGAAPKSSAEKK